jgi:hypothetical protein
VRYNRTHNQVLGLVRRTLTNSVARCEDRSLASWAETTAGGLVVTVTWLPGPTMWDTAIEVTGPSLDQVCRR